MKTYTLVNPLINGVVDRHADSESPIKAAKEFHKRHTKILKNSLPSFCFSIQDNNNKLYHFEVHESQEISDDAKFTKVNYNISELKDINDDALRDFQENLGKEMKAHEQLYGGGSKDDDDSSSSSSSEEDKEHHDEMKKIRRRQRRFQKVLARDRRRSLLDWWYYPGLYHRSLFHQPLFISGLSGKSQIKIMYNLRTGKLMPGIALARGG